MIDWTKPLRTTITHYPVEVLKTDLNSVYPIVVVVKGNHDLGDYVQALTTDGKNYANHTDIFVENVPEKIRGWINIYKFGSLSNYSVSQIYQTRKEADQYDVGNSRFVCIEIEFEEGQGIK